MKGRERQKKNNKEQIIDVTTGKVFIFTQQYKKSKGLVEQTHRTFNQS